MSYAPGALDAMMILALALHLDPIFVGAHHVARFMLISAALPLFVRIYGQTPPPPPSEAAGKAAGAGGLSVSRAPIPPPARG